MAILNFQKPDKVIMIDSSEFEGKFEFRPLEPGYGLTVGNALRRDRGKVRRRESPPHWGKTDHSEWPRHRGVSRRTSQRRPEFRIA